MTTLPLQVHADDVATAPVRRDPRARRRPRLGVFALLQLYMAAVVFVGFAPSFYLQPARVGAMHPAIHIHAGVMTLWIVFMAIQGVLPATGRVGLHRTLGWWGAGLAVLILVTGVMITVEGVHDGHDPFKLGSGEAFAAIPFRDLATFTGFFVVGLLTRKTAPDAHRRMMTLATLSVIPAALGRLMAFTPEPVVTTVNYLPVAVMVAYDLWTRHRVLTSTWLGSGVLIVATPLCIAMGKSAWWQDMIRAVT